MFRISGTFKMGSKWQKFTKEIDANSKDEAMERVYSLLGSNHKVKRIHIKIEKVEEIKDE